MCETFLPAVEIDGRDALTGFTERCRNVQSRGGLARPALLVSQNHDVSRLTRLLYRLH
jgi:hypothetical protein